MKFAITLMLFLACLWAGSAYAANGCGPGCHSAVNGGCVVDGWESGARVWNECPAGAHARPPCSPNYTWIRRAKACLLIN